MNLERALVVDDSKLARVNLSKLLQKQGFEVEMLESGEAALERLKAVGKPQPDIIFMDYMMPGLDGYETTRSIADDPTTAAIPVIMCTSLENEESERGRALEFGAAGFIKKPITDAKIKEAIEALRQSPQPHHAEIAPGRERPALSAPSVDLLVFREEILAASANVAEEVAHGVIESVLESVTAGLSDDMKRHLTETIREVTAPLIAPAIEKQLNANIQPAVDAAMSTHQLALEANLDARLADLTPAEPAQSAQSAAAIDSDALLAQAREAARQVAQESAKRVAQESAKEMSGELADLVGKQLSSPIRQEMLGELEKKLVGLVQGDGLRQLVHRVVARDLEQFALRIRQLEEQLMDRGRFDADLEVRTAYNSLQERVKELEAQQASDRGLVLTTLGVGALALLAAVAAFVL